MQMVEAAEAKAGLHRQLGLASATATVVGEVIAVGIFLTPVAMYKSLGSPMWLGVVWLVMGIMALSGALCYGELAARFPEAGGGYVYLREAYGSQIAFLYGWKSLLVMDPGITAALSIGAVTYLGYIVPLSSITAKVIAVVIIWLFAMTNILGVKLGAVVMRWLAILKIGLLAAIILWAMVLQRGDWSNFLPLVTQRPGSEPLIGALAGSLVAAFFSFGGWWDVSKLGGEVQNPSRTLPRALAYGVITVTLVYMLVSDVFLYLVPAERVTSADVFMSQAGEVLFGRTGGVVFSVIVIISVLGSLEAIVMSAPRVYFAMARDHLFFPAAAALHPRFKTPTRAIWLQAGLASVLVLSGNFNQIIAYFIFITVVFIALTVAAVFVLRKKYSDAPAFRVPGYPFTPLLFLILVAVLLSLLAMNNPLQAFIGVAVVGLGAIVYRIASIKN